MSRVMADILEAGGLVGYINKRGPFPPCWQFARLIQQHGRRKSREWWKFLDCTLRDGGNVVGAGFGGEATVKIIEALIGRGIRVS